MKYIVWFFGSKTNSKKTFLENIDYIFYIEEFIVNY